VRALKLDLCCGSRPSGDVNLDLNVTRSLHHKYDYDPRLFRHFVRASAQDLPFRGDVFRDTVINHGLEHLPEPLKAVRDMRRVTERLFIRVPNHPIWCEFAEHLYSWSAVSLRNFLHMVYEDVVVRRQCRYFQLTQTRVFRRMLKIAYVKFLFERVMGAVLAVELEAVCWKVVKPPSVAEPWVCPVSSEDADREWREVLWRRRL